MAFPLTDEQKKIVDDRGGELLVSAAAGSGKTRVLVERLLDRVTREGLDLDRFLVITYTKAAAAELRTRIAQELSSRLAEDPGDRHLRRQSTLVYRAQISTIHSFCSALLREERQKKVDQAVRMMRLFSLLPILQESGLLKGLLGGGPLKRDGQYAEFHRAPILSALPGINAQLPLARTSDKLSAFIIMEIQANSATISLDFLNFFWMCRLKNAVIPALPARYPCGRRRGCAR